MRHVLISLNALFTLATFGCTVAALDMPNAQNVSIMFAILSATFATNLSYLVILPKSH